MVRIDAGVESKKVREHCTKKINFTFADKWIGTYPQRGRQPANRHAFKQPVNRFGFEFFYGIQFLARQSGPLRMVSAWQVEGPQDLDQCLPVQQG